MTSLTLDGSTRYVGTDFVKILNTGTSNLATEDFVLEQVASGGTSTTDLPGYYNLTQTNTLLDTKYNITAVNTLLDTKLNIGNPQDISGVMRLGHIDGLSKIILNSVGSNGKDFYVNGDSEVNGNFLASSINSNGFIQGSSITSNTINATNTNDIFFQSNNAPYAQFDYADDCFRFVKNVDAGNITCNGNLNINSMDTIGDVDMVFKQNNENIIELKPDDRIVANKLIQCGGNLKTQEIDTIAPLDLIFKVSGQSKLELAENLTTLNTKTECVNNIVCDNFESRDLSTVSNYIMNDTTGQIKFYVGSPITPDTTTNLVMTLENNLITFHKPTSPEIGGTIDDSDYVKKLGETGQLINGSMEFQGTTSQTFKFSMGGPSNFAQYRRFEIYNSEIVSYRVIKCTNALGLQSNLINSYTDTDLIFQRNSNNILQLNTRNQLQFLQGAGKSCIYEDEFVDGGTINAFRIRNTENTNTAYVSFGVGDVLDVFQTFKTGITSAVEMTIPNVLCNAFDSFGNNDVVFSRNGVEYMKFEGTLSSVELAQGVKANIYSSIGNSDVSFRRNTIDFFYLRNNQVETNSGISLYSNDAKINTINTTGDNDMVIQRNGITYLTLNATSNIVDVENTKALSSNYLYCNYLRSRSFTTNDMVFEGANLAGSGCTEFMSYRKGEEDVMISKDAYIIQDKRFYFHKGSSVNSYITSTNMADVSYKLY